MTTINNARDRAEELLHNLQKRARELLEAEEGLVSTVRALVEERGFTPGEVKKKLDELVGLIKSNTVWERVSASGALGMLADARGEVERRVEGSVQRLLSSLSIASRTDVDDLGRQLSALESKLSDLEHKLEAH